MCEALFIEDEAQAGCVPEHDRAFLKSVACAEDGVAAGVDDFDHQVIGQGGCDCRYHSGPCRVYFLPASRQRPFAILMSSKWPHVWPASRHALPVVVALPLVTLPFGQLGGPMGAIRRASAVSVPTIIDVANCAGVAAITVSRVVNDSGPVSKQVRVRVEGAIAEIGYVPNSVARSLRSKRTDTIALVVTDMTNPFFTTIARGVEDAASDAGMMLIICNTDERRR